VLPPTLDTDLASEDKCSALPWKRLVNLPTLPEKLILPYPEKSIFGFRCTLLTADGQNFQQVKY
jgi:hypothetical protein